MAYLALFTIRNSAFDYAAYGLTSNTFVIDITTSVQASKAVNFTQYPLLDGTTRLDSVSRAPGTLNFQGKVGEVFHSNRTGFTCATDDAIETRMQRFVRLLENLRDDAIVLDITTESKTFENYLIESIGIGIAQFGVVDVNFSMKEFISFGSEITAIEFEAGEYTEATRNEFYLNSLTMKNFSTDQQLLDSIYELLTDTDIAEPYMIKMGSGDFGFNPDIYIRPISVRKPTLRIDRQDAFVAKAVTRTYTPTYVSFNTPIMTHMTGKVVNDYKLKITLPTLQGNSSLVKETVIRNENSYGLFQGGDYNYKPDIFSEEGKYTVKIEFYDGENVIDTRTPDDIFLTPKYSEIINGVNPLNYTSNNFGNDLILSDNNNPIHKNVLSFLRKTKDPKVYQMAPNLLKDTSYGYLYAVKYLKDRNGATEFHLGFIYFHPELVKRLENLMNTFNITSSNLLYNKTIKWW